MHKQTLILIPGLLCDKTVWDHQIQCLSEDADILVPDISCASTPDAMIKTALTNAPDQFALAGHSMGGWVALEIMRQHAHQVTKLCLINTTAALDSPAKAASRNELIMLAHENKNDDIIDRLLTAFCYKPPIKDKLRKMLVRNVHCLINQEKAMQLREDCMSVLHDIHCPTLIIHANQDKVFHLEDSELLHKGISDSTLVRIDDCGHMSPMEARDEVTRLMKEWLTG